MDLVTDVEIVPMDDRGLDLHLTYTSDSGLTLKKVLVSNGLQAAIADKGSAHVVVLQDVDAFWTLLVAYSVVETSTGIRPQYSMAIGREHSESYGISRQAYLQIEDLAKNLITNGLVLTVTGLHP